MTIDLSTETPIAFSEAGKHIPGDPHVSTLHRWRLHGIRGVKLETFLSGGRRFTTSESVSRFLAHLNGTEPAPSTRQKADRAKRVESTQRQLRAAGIA